MSSDKLSSVSCLPLLSIRAWQRLDSVTLAGWDLGVLLISIVWTTWWIHNRVANPSEASSFFKYKIEYGKKHSRQENNMSWQSNGSSGLQLASLTIPRHKGHYFPKQWMNYVQTTPIINPLPPWRLGLKLQSEVLFTLITKYTLHVII